MLRSRGNLRATLLAVKLESSRRGSNRFTKKIVPNFQPQPASGHLHVATAEGRYEAHQRTPG